MSGWFPRLVAEGLQSGADQIISARKQTAVWFPVLTCSSIQICRAGWQAANGEIAMDDASEEDSVLYTKLRKMDNVEQLWEDDARCHYCIDSADSCLDKVCRVYRDDPICA